MIELMVVIGIIGILTGVVIVAINPARQFANARNTQRIANINAILNGVDQRIADNKGTFETGCPAGAVPTSSVRMATSTYDIAQCLVPIYLPSMPFDPSDQTAFYTSTSSYNSGYNIQKDSNIGNRITVSAPSAELGQTISVTR